MKKIKIMFDFGTLPIWLEKDGCYYPEMGEITDKNLSIKNIAEEMKEIFDSCYEFNTHGVPCWFDEEKLMSQKEKLLHLIGQIKKELTISYDNDVEIIDLASKELNR